MSGDARGDGCRPGTKRQSPPTALGRLRTMALDPALLTWLLDSDPALRWQVERDLVGAPPEVWQATRARIATEGFGARLLALQDPDGQWAGGAFSPRTSTSRAPRRRRTPASRGR